MTLQPWPGEQLEQVLQTDGGQLASLKEHLKVWYKYMQKWLFMLQLIDDMEEDLSRIILRHSHRKLKGSVRSLMLIQHLQCILNSHKIMRTSWRHRIWRCTTSPFNVRHTRWRVSTMRKQLPKARNVWSSWGSHEHPASCCRHPAEDCRTKEAFSNLIY